MKKISLFFAIVLCVTWSFSQIVPQFKGHEVKGNIYRFEDSLKKEGCRRIEMQILPSTQQKSILMEGPFMGHSCPIVLTKALYSDSIVKAGAQVSIVPTQTDLREYGKGWSTLQEAGKIVAEFDKLEKQIVAKYGEPSAKDRDRDKDSHYFSAWISDGYRMSLWIEDRVTELVLWLEYTNIACEEADRGKGGNDF